MFINVILAVAGLEAATYKVVIFFLLNFSLLLMH